jgi:hypothetical protein
VDWHDHEAQDHTAQAKAFFTSIAETYGTLPNILYETYNEPLDTASWPDDVKPYHEEVVATIRDIDPDNVIILGSPNWSQDVDVAAEDPVEGSNLMYTLHFYACTHKEALRTKAQAARDLGLPIFVTEWGATSAIAGEETYICEVEAQLWHDWMNANSIGSLAWGLCDITTEANCMVRPGTSETGGWDGRLVHQGPFVRDKLQGYDYSCDNPRIIDTLEDKDSSICKTAGRNGQWFVASDETGTLQPFEYTKVPKTLSPQRGKSLTGAYLSGTGFTDWGALLGVTLVQGSSSLEYFDATGLSGIRFHARGSGTLTVEITTGSTTPTPDGHCNEDDCYHPFDFDVTLEDADWVPYVIP